MILWCPSAQAATDWPFPDEYRSRLVFVHPLVNYTVHPVWQRQWERSLVRSNGVQTTVGSVATEDLYTDLTVNLTEPLGGRFRFLYRMIWRQGLHLDVARQEHWLGFEMGLSGTVAVHLQVHPTPDKEEFDLLAGILLTDAARERFLKLSLRLDDFMYERKNDGGGVSATESAQVQWEGRHRAGRWEIFSAGRYGSGSRRSYPDSNLSPVVEASGRKDGGATLRLRYLWEEDGFAGLELAHYLFEAEEQVRDPGQSYEYDNEFLHLRGLGYLGIGAIWSLRPEVHWLGQNAAASGGRRFTHDRRDFFPALFAELHAPGKSTWELGYMGTHYTWEYVVGGWTDDRDGYTDKIKFGWTYAFLPTARIQFSLSHELDLDRFGGGNVQFQVVF